MITADLIILDNDTQLRTQRHETVPAGISLEEVERRAILKTLDKNEGNKSATADELGVSIKTLYNKLERYSNDQYVILVIFIRGYLFITGVIKTELGVPILELTKETLYLSEYGSKGFYCKHYKE